MMRPRSVDATDGGTSHVAATLLEWGLGGRPVGLLIGPEAVVDLFSPYAFDLAPLLSHWRAPHRTSQQEYRERLDAYATVKKLQALPEFYDRGLSKEQELNERSAGVLRSRAKRAPVDLIVLDELDLDAMHLSLVKAVEALMASAPRLCLARLGPSPARPSGTESNAPVWQLPAAPQGHTQDLESTLYWQQLLDRLVYALAVERREKAAPRTRDSSHWKKA